MRAEPSPRRIEIDTTDLDAIDRGVIFWDFDYTLGFRGVLAENEHRHPWAACLIEVLDAHEPGHSISVHDIRPHIRDGFPWNRHSDPHPELCDAGAWWQSAERLFTRAFEGVGVDAGRSHELAGRVRPVFADHSAWSLYPDTLPALRALKDMGWRHVVVSNHVPELEHIVSSLGLSPLVDHIVCSALTGFEKPHPEAFRSALRLVGGAGRTWMVGDNPEADVRGAEAVGIPAIQVRTRRADAVRYYSEDLSGVLDIVSIQGNGEA